jgi:hypothetical protein
MNELCQHLQSRIKNHRETILNHHLLGLVLIRVHTHLIAVMLLGFTAMFIMKYVNTTVMAATYA